MVTDSIIEKKFPVEVLTCEGNKPKMSIGKILQVAQGFPTDFNLRAESPSYPSPMATPIRSIPVLEGEVARRFVKEAKENEKKRGTQSLSPESKEVYRKIMTEYRKRTEQSTE
jgi:hypothetical protein